MTEFHLSPRSGANYETLFSYAYRTDESFYAWLERSENAFRLIQFSRSMSAGRAAEGRLDISDTAGAS